MYRMDHADYFCAEVEIISLLRQTFNSLARQSDYSPHNPIMNQQRFCNSRLTHLG